jgi:hypothetical protein
MKKHTLFVVIVLILIVSGTASCSREQASSGEVPGADDQSRLAAAAFRAFFDHLAAGNYRQAAAHYGGSFDVLRSYNPGANPEDQAVLLKLACLTNGYQCLTVDEITAVRENTPAEWLITASFLTDQGEVFSRGACCGADEGDQPAETEFTFRVKKVPSGEYLVMDLPVYVP